MVTKRRRDRKKHDKLYYERHKERILERTEEYRMTHKAQASKKSLRYYYRNRDKIRRNRRIYYLKCCAKKTLKHYYEPWEWEVGYKIEV